MQLERTQFDILKDYVEIFYRRKWLFIFTFVPTVATAFLISFTLPPIYRSTTSILVERQKVPEAYVTSTVTSNMKEKLRTLKTQIMSRTRLEKIINDYDLYHYNVKALGIIDEILFRFGVEKKPPTREEIVDRMRKDIDISVKGRDSFTVSYIGPEPELTMNITNALASMFIEENLRIVEELAEGTSEFLISALENAESVLERREEAVREFKEKFMGSLPEQLETNLRTLDRLQIQSQTLNDSLRTVRNRKIFLEEQLSVFTAIDPVTNTIIGEIDPLELELKELQRKLSHLRSVFKESYPDVIIAQNRIKEVEKLLADRKTSEGDKSDKPVTRLQSREETRLRGELKEINSEISSLRAKDLRNKRQIKEFETRVEKTPANEQKLTTLIRDYSVMRENYQSLLGKKLNAQLSENMEKRQKGERFRVLDSANLPEKPHGKRPFKMRLFGLGGGVGVGIGLIALVEFLNPAFRKPEDFIGLTDIPVFATIPMSSIKVTKKS